MCVGTSDPRPESTYVIEPKLCAPWWVLLLLEVRVPTSGMCVCTSDPRTENTHL